MTRKPTFAEAIERTTERARGFAEALAPILAEPTEPAYAQALVPPLQMAADSAGVKLKKLAFCYYQVNGTAPYIITISVSSEGYEVRKTHAIRGRVRWKTLGKWKRPARVMREVKPWTEAV